MGEHLRRLRIPDRLVRSVREIGHLQCAPHLADARHRPAQELCRPPSLLGCRYRLRSDLDVLLDLSGEEEGHDNVLLLAETRKEASVVPPSAEM